MPENLLIIDHETLAIRPEDVSAIFNMRYGGWTFFLRGGQTIRVSKNEAQAFLKAMRESGRNEP